MDSVINDAVAGVVTKDEHAPLSSSVQSGWDRYNDCGIRIFDTEDQEWLELDIFNMINSNRVHVL